MTTQWLPAGDALRTGPRGTQSEPLVKAEPFRDVLSRLIENSRYTVRMPRTGHQGFAAGRSRGGRVLGPTTWLEGTERTCGGRSEVARAYAERFGTTTRTADRHISIVQQRERIPLVIADRIAALAGEPLEYVMAGTA